MRPIEMLFVIALVLYSIAIWSHRFQKTLHPWMIVVFQIGLMADISGTLFLCVAASTKWTWSLHTISGLASLLIMTLHFVWALLAPINEKLEVYFNRFSIYAWGLWLVAFISGIPR